VLELQRTTGYGRVSSVAERRYWLSLFTAETWQEFLDAGGKAMGFRASRWPSVQRIREGDYLLCYMVGISRWVGILEAVSRGYQDETPIWSSDPFPSRVKVRIVVALTPETGVPVVDMRDELSVFRNLQNPNRWSGAFRGSPLKWPTTDGQAVVRAVTEAQKDPHVRPVNKAKLGYRPKLQETPSGDVTFPESVQDEDTLGDAKQETEHTEIQYKLLRLGSDMKYDVWVARNDKGKAWRGRAFSDIPRLKRELPILFEKESQDRVERIDVLWLRGSAIVAAFEIESTTAIYSGLLRMADLLVLQPNLRIPFFVVAPDERRDNVMREVQRPTFRRLPTPMWQVCRYLSFSDLRDGIKSLGEHGRRYSIEGSQDWLQAISESCEPGP
jgi:predicted RNA-binding protein